MSCTHCSASNLLCVSVAGPVDREGGEYPNYYTFPLTRLTEPGVQTRTMFDPVFPQAYFSGLEAASIAEEMPTSFLSDAGALTDCKQG